MSEITANSPEHENAFAVLRRFARRRTPAEHCELCSAEVQPEHPHLLQTENRHILCSCEPCAVLFGGQASAHYRRIPRDCRQLTDFVVSDELWESLMIPINLAFFYGESESGRVVAMYPSPAGAVESLLSLDAWNEIISGNAALKSMTPEVEALLVNRVGSAREYFLAPIDQCYRLVGVIRVHWKGLSGGSEVWQQIERFFQQLRGANDQDRRATRA
jgi:hypothetical protein